MPLMFVCIMYVCDTHMCLFSYTYFFYQFLKVPLGTGLAFSIKYREEDKVCMCMYGDGGANQGQVCELMNTLHTLHMQIHTCVDTHTHAHTHEHTHTQSF